MTIQFDSTALAHRLAVLDQIGVGPLWLRRDALFDSSAAAPVAPPQTTARETAVERAPVLAPAPPAPIARPPVARSAPAATVVTRPDDAAWDDSSPAAAANAGRAIKTVLTLCTKMNNADQANANVEPDAARYLFITRASSVQGAEALFDNILLALGMQKQAATQGDTSDLNAQIASHKPTVLIVMEPTAALHLIDGSEPAGDASAMQAAYESLRGRVHRAGGLPAWVTYDAPHLLRYPADKRKVWEDLCRLQTGRAADVADPT